MFQKMSSICTISKGDCKGHRFCKQTTSESTPPHPKPVLTIFSTDVVHRVVGLWGQPAVHLVGGGHALKWVLHAPFSQQQCKVLLECWTDLATHTSVRGSIYCQTEACSNQSLTTILEKQQHKMSENPSLKFAT